MSDPDSRAGQESDLAARQPDRVGRDLARAEKADLAQPVGRPPPGLRFVLGDLFPGLGEVVVNEGLLARGQVAGSQPGIGPADVDPLRGDERRHPPVALPPVDEGRGVVQGPTLLGRHFGVEDRPPEEAAGSEVLDGAGDGVLEVVEVEEGGRPSEEHLGHPGARPGLHVGLGPVRVDGE